MMFDNMMLMLTNNYGIQLGNFLILFFEILKKRLSKISTVNLFYNNVNWSIDNLGLELKWEKR